MKLIKTTNRFQAHYKARVAKNGSLKEQFRENVEVFLHDRRLVDDHQLEGKMSLFRSFAISDDYRVVYIETPDYFLFLDVGTHEEVYYR